MEPGNPPGDIFIDDSSYQESDDAAAIAAPEIISIDQERLKQTVSTIRRLIGYETYDIAVLFLSDADMQETNLETRGIDAPTDILSFGFLPPKRPGKLQKPDFDVPDYYNLGDLLVDLAYVKRRCEEDREYYENSGTDNDDELEEEEEDDTGDEEYYEYEDDDRGVSGAMARVYDVEERVNMLMVHGMLHLVGYDHETEEDYEEMVTREEELLKELGFMNEPKPE